jgi:hypothetical protein
MHTRVLLCVCCCVSLESRFTSCAPCMPRVLLLRYASVTEISPTPLLPCCACMLVCRRMAALRLQPRTRVVLVRAGSADEAGDAASVVEGQDLANPPMPLDALGSAAGVPVAPYYEQVWRLWPGEGGGNGDGCGWGGGGAGGWEGRRKLGTKVLFVPNTPKHSPGALLMDGGLWPFHGRQFSPLRVFPCCVGVFVVVA